MGGAEASCSSEYPTLTELGQLAPIRYNTSAAQFLSRRLEDEGISTLSVLHKLLWRNNPSDLAMAESLAQSDPAPLVTRMVLALFFEYAFDNTGIKPDDTRVIEQAVTSEQ